MEGHFLLYYLKKVASAMVFFESRWATALSEYDFIPLDVTVEQKEKNGFKPVTPVKVKTSQQH